MISTEDNTCVHVNIIRDSIEIVKKKFNLKRISRFKKGIK